MELLEVLIPEKEYKGEVLLIVWKRLSSLNI
jgi:hypothetical protein